MTNDNQISVLIVDDIAETRENIRKLLQFETDIEVAGVARTGREAIEVAKEITPDVIIMDINMPDMDGIQATEIIREEVPFSQIVILSVQNDSNYMRRAMLAGARDFLSKPPMVDELISAIRRAGMMAAEERKKTRAVQTQPIGAGEITGASSSASLGKIIVVYSPKGGVGSTTIATNLSVALHNEETPVVIVDGNLQFGDVAVMLNERSKNSILDLATRADELDPEIIENVLVTHESTGVNILSAPPRPEDAEEVSGVHFGDILKYLRRMFAYVIVDTSSILTDYILTAMDDSNLVVLLATQNIPAINNARLFLDLVDILGIDRRTVLFGINKYDKRIGITLDAIGDNLKHEVMFSLPVDDKVVIPSVNRGVPFIYNTKSKPISKALLELAKLVRQRLREVEDIEMEDYAM